MTDFYDEKVGNRKYMRDYSTKWEMPPDWSSYFTEAAWLIPTCHFLFWDPTQIHNHLVTDTLPNIPAGPWTISFIHYHFYFFPTALIFYCCEKCHNRSNL